jgi:hypothetical protein
VPEQSSSANHDIGGPTLEMRVFRRAADLMGSEKELAGLMRVPVRLVFAWISGAQLPSQKRFLEAIDVMIDLGEWASDAEIFKAGKLDRAGRPPFRFLSTQAYLRLTLAERRDFVRDLLDHVRDFSKDDGAF